MTTDTANESAANGLAARPALPDLRERPRQALRESGISGATLKQWLKGGVRRRQRGCRRHWDGLQLFLADGGSTWTATPSRTSPGRLPLQERMRCSPAMTKALLLGAA